MSTFPHCHHCCWDNEHHPDTHRTPCWTGCPGATPDRQGVLL